MQCQRPRLVQAALRPNAISTRTYGPDADVQGEPPDSLVLSGGLRDALPYCTGRGQLTQTVVPSAVAGIRRRSPAYRLVMFGSRTFDTNWWEYHEMMGGLSTALAGIIGEVACAGIRAELIAPQSFAAGHGRIANLET